MNADLNRILEMLRNLRARATNNTNVHEAAVATEKIQALLLKYNLTLAQVEGHRLKDEYGRHSTHVGGSGMWRRTLMQHICTVNFCTSVYTPGTTHMTIIGQAHNVQIVQGLFDYLQSEVVRLCEKGWNDERRRVRSYFESVPHGRAWKNSFYLGATVEIGKILREQRKQSMNDGQTRALVLDRDAEVQAALKVFYPTLGQASRSRIRDGGAFRAGQQAARGINFNKQVGGGTLALGRGR
jgi:hypothetical protein